MRTSHDNAAAAHDAESADLDVSIEALTRKIAALEKGVADSDSFQSGVGHAIRKVVMNLEKVKQLVEVPKTVSHDGTPAADCGADC